MIQIHLHVLLEYLKAACRKLISIFNEMQYRQLNRRCLEQIIHNSIHDKIHDIACELFGLGFEEQFFLYLVFPSIRPSNVHLHLKTS